MSTESNRRVRNAVERSISNTEIVYVGITDPDDFEDALYLLDDLGREGDADVEPGLYDIWGTLNGEEWRIMLDSRRWERWD